MTQPTTTMKKYAVNVDVGFYLEVSAADEERAAALAMDIVSNAIPSDGSGNLMSPSHAGVEISVGEPRCEPSLGDVQEAIE